MDEKMVLDWLVEDTRQNAGRYYKPVRNLREALYRINNEKEKNLPDSLPRDETDMVRVLRDRFNNNVTFISLVLHHHFPNRYLFYRVSSLEQEIFAGFNFLKPVVPQFAFGFSRVGGTGFARYLQLNEALLDFARAHWPRDRDSQRKLTYFLYQGLGRLFQEKPTDHHYWVMATRERYFWALDSGEDVQWSGRKEMQTGDLVFMYRTRPRSAITDIYRLKGEPRFDPWCGWNGFRVDMEKVCAIEAIPFAEMRNDPTLSEWSTVKKSFAGTITEPMPPIVYNGLLERVPSTLRAEHNLKPEVMAGSESEPDSGAITPPLSHPPTLSTPKLSGRFSLESEFEEKVIVPLLKQWKLKYRAQHACPVWIGSQEHQLRVDFLVSDDEGPLTLFENKLRIFDDKDLQPAVGQARSYALLLGLPSFVVASPGGMWLYALDRSEAKLVEQLSTVKPREQQEKELRDLLLGLRS